MAAQEEPTQSARISHSQAKLLLLVLTPLLQTRRLGSLHWMTQAAESPALQQAYLRLGLKLQPTAPVGSLAQSWAETLPQTLKALQQMR